MDSLLGTPTPCQVSGEPLRDFPGAEVLWEEQWVQKVSSSAATVNNVEINLSVYLFNYFMSHFSVGSGVTGQLVESLHP